MDNFSISLLKFELWLFWINAALFELDNYLYDSLIGIDFYFACFVYNSLSKNKKIRDFIKYRKRTWNIKEIFRKY